MLREAHAFLHEHGCINTGAALAGEPPASGGGKEEAAPVQLSARFARWTIIHVTAKTKPQLECQQKRAFEFRLRFEL